MNKDFTIHTPRLTWDEYFMNIAYAVALRGSCCRRQVAAIVVKDHRIISTGYNGTPRGAKNCNEGGCTRCNASTSDVQSGTALGECLCSHGEENAITQAAYHGISVKGATLYSTLGPCLFCSKLIINSGITEVVYKQTYMHTDAGFGLMISCGINLRQFIESPMLPEQRDLTTKLTNALAEAIDMLTGELPVDDVRIESLQERLEQGLNS